MTVNDIIKNQKSYFKSGETKAYEFRIKQLNKLKEGVIKYQQEILMALNQDLKKPVFEGITSEVGYVLHSIDYVTQKLEKWMQDEHVDSGDENIDTYIHYVPFGTVLIIAPFNYPFQLALEPLIGAIAAGNTIVLKPSRYTSATERVLENMIDEIFEANYITTVTGNREVLTELIHAPFDDIFFTGSVPVGKIVMKAAAENLTPVTLELGGKSPAIVHKDANLDFAVKRISWAKYINNGQTCITPDYIYVHEDIRDKFLEKVKTYIINSYGENASESPDYCRIVDKKQFNRLEKLITKDKVYYGGNTDESQLYIQPTILKDVVWTDSVMSDEIFGPIMPVLSYKDINEVFDGISNSPKPLALYIFTEDENIQNRIIEEIPFGGGCINDTMSHVASYELPFGGVGHSGMGSYHGKQSFKAFSHAKSILKNKMKTANEFAYPPYEGKVEMLNQMMNQK